MALTALWTQCNCYRSFTGSDAFNVAVASVCHGHTSNETHKNNDRKRHEVQNRPFLSHGCSFFFQRLKTSHSLYKKIQKIRGPFGMHPKTNERKINRISLKRIVKHLGYNLKCLSLYGGKKIIRFSHGDGIACDT